MRGKETNKMSNIIHEGAIVGLMKFFQCREYAEDLINGTLFCHESGWFRRLEDNFRGDEFDGKIPIYIDGQEIKIGDITGIGIGYLKEGFVGDDKLPVYSMTIIDKNILIQHSEWTYSFKPEFLTKMEKFGQYVAMITDFQFFDEIVNDYAEKESLLLSMYRVDYGDVRNKYSTNNERNKNSLERFFFKDYTYEYQNEIRLIWQKHDRTPLICENTDFVKIDLKQKLKGTVITMDEIKYNQMFDLS
jgi:hypothetical protein